MTTHGRSGPFSNDRCRLGSRAAMNSVPSSPTSSQRGCLTPDTSGVRVPSVSSRTTRPARSSATRSRPSRSKASPMGRSRPRATTAVDRSEAMLVMVPVARSLT